MVTIATLQTFCSTELVSAPWTVPWAELAVLGTFYAAVCFLHCVLPAYRTDGYACDWNGRALRYRLNGPLVLMVTVCAWWMLASNAPACASFAARHFWPLVSAANVIGIIAASALAWGTADEPAHR